MSASSSEKSSESTDSGVDRLNAHIWPFCKEDADFIRRAARRFGVPPDAVDDAVQDVLMVCLMRYRELGQFTLVRAWLLAVTRHVCNNHRRAWLRSRRRDALAAIEFESEASADRTSHNPEEQLQHLETRHALNAAMSRLSVTHRKALFLIGVNQMSAVEAGSHMKVSPNTVASWFRRARLRCQHKLGSSLS